MKVGILTFHNAFNYGAVLQAYATQELVKSMGHEAELIDYHNARIDLTYEKRKFHFRSFLRSTYKFPLYLLAKFFYWKRRKAYQEFVNNHLKLSNKIYYQGDDISIEGYNVVLIGSDQLWNKKITGGLDNMYWGQFEASPVTRKVAWSVCMNNLNSTESEIEQIKNYLNNFTAISVRENTLQAFISKLTDKKVWHTLDPTLLLPSSKWERLCYPVKKNNYVAVYAVRKEKETISFARKIASKLNKKIVIIRSYAKWYFSNENMECGGPTDFLSYIKNADFVVTSSFHGTVFSILFQRQFVCPRFDGNVRIEDMLCTIGLADRMVNDSQEAVHLPSIDYHNLSEKFNAKKNESFCFLKGVMNKL